MRDVNLLVRSSVKIAREIRQGRAAGLEFRKGLRQNSVVVEIVVAGEMLILGQS